MGMRCKALGRLAALALVALAVPSAGQEDSNCEVSDLDEYDFMVRGTCLADRIVPREGRKHVSHALCLIENILLLRARRAGCARLQHQRDARVPRESVNIVDPPAEEERGFDAVC